MAENIRISSNRNIVSQFLSIFLFFGGIWTCDKYQKYGDWYSKLTIFLLLIQLLGCYIGFLNRPQIQNGLILLIEIVFHIYSFSLHCIIKVRKNDLYQFKLLFEGKHSASLDEEAVHLTTNLFQTITNSFFWMNLLFILVITIITSFIPFFVDIQFMDKYWSVYKLWFYCTNLGNNKFFLTFLCWNVDNYRKYILVNFVEAILLMIELFPSCAIIYFYVLAQVHFCSRMNVINNRIKRWFLDNEPNRRDESVMYKNLTEIIKYHQHLHRYAKQSLVYLELLFYEKSRGSRSRKYYFVIEYRIY